MAATRLAEVAPSRQEEAQAAIATAAAPAAATLVRRWTLAATFLGALLTVAIVGALTKARPLLVPIAAAMLLAMALAPLVRWLRMRGAPQGLAVTGVATGLIALLVAAGNLLLAPLVKAVDMLPAFDALVTRMHEGVSRVFGEPSGAWLSARWQEAVTSTALPAKAFAGLVDFGALALATLLLTFFLLASGDLFLQKLVRVLPRIRDKVKAVKVVNAVQDEVGRYMAITTVINTLLGTAAALIAWSFDLPTPVLWGIVVALLNFIPYVGAIANVAILTAVSAATHAALGDILAAPLVFAAVTAVEGNIITPVVVSRRVQLNAVTVVVGLMFWGWVWGIVGALLAVPLLIVMKAFAQHVERLEPLNEFMGR